METVQVRCPKCQVTVDIPPPRPGTRLQCSHCQTIFAVGEPGAPPLLFTPAPGAEPAQSLEVLDSSEQLALRRAARSSRTKDPKKLLVLGVLGGGLAVVLAIGITLALWPSSSASKAKQVDAHPATKPVATKATAPTATKASRPAVLTREEDLEVAKRRATAQKKDLLLWFDGSDWSPAAQRLTQDVFENKEFIDKIGRQYIVVWLDFPEHNAGKAKVRDLTQNEDVRHDYAVGSLPTVLLADAQARPYAYIEGYRGDGGAAFAKVLEDRRKARAQRDQLLEDVALANGETQLDAAQKALAFLRQLGPEKDSFRILAFYETFLDDWFELAVKLEPDNAKGRLEELFTLHWLVRAHKLAHDNPRAREELVDELTSFKKAQKFRDTNRAAVLHLWAAAILMEARQFEDARKWATDGLALQPSDSQLRQGLASLKVQLGLGGDAGFVVSTGSAFVVAVDGPERFLLTNHHVIAGGGQLFVLLPDGKDRIPATVVAEDKKRDIALLRLQAPGELPLLALPVAWNRELKPGDKKPVALAEDIAVFGYPLAGVLGSGVKFTQGAISAEPDAENENMLLLNCLVNPGNSGGPLCDHYGNVVGMVRAKIGTAQGGDSYGQAIPASMLEAFLAQHVPHYQPAKAHTEKRDWKDIAAQVKDSVLMVVRVQ